MLSLCIITKDEEIFLPACFQAVQDIVDEIVVVDTGSTDRTVEIAKGFCAKVYFTPWEEDFAKAKNVALGYATGDWVLNLDADEIIDAKGCEEVKRLISSNTADAFYLLQRTYTNYTKGLGFVRLASNAPFLLMQHLNLPQKEFSGHYTTKIIRLFRNKNITFVGAIHEDARPALEKKGMGIAESAVVMHHFHELKGDAFIEKKRDSYLRMLRKRFDELQTAKAAYDLGLGIYDRKKDIDEARQYVEKALEMEPDFEEALFTLGVFSIKEKKYEGGITYFEKVLSLNPRNYWAYTNLALLYATLKEWKKCKVVYEKALEKGHPEMEEILGQIKALEGKLSD
ncbi:MAG TPA: glycosyltransferase [Candidatus Nanoarchaeia archaeon]|nr:glycosyltransferase [Candidatus Nanoarchaeia archaeon]